MFYCCIQQINILFTLVSVTSLFGIVFIENSGLDKSQFNGMQNRRGFVLVIAQSFNNMHTISCLLSYEGGRKLYCLYFILHVLQ